LEVADTFAKYKLAGVAQNIKQHVLILAGSEDQWVPVEQVDLFKKALVNARSVTAKVYDPASGGHEHSQLGVHAVVRGFLRLDG
jgi:dienelactone hydrolase